MEIILTLAKVIIVNNEIFCETQTIIHHKYKVFPNEEQQYIQNTNDIFGVHIYYTLLHKFVACSII